VGRQEPRCRTAFKQPHINQSRSQLISKMFSTCFTDLSSPAGERLDCLFNRDNRKLIHQKMRTFVFTVAVNKFDSYSTVELCQELA
jgi:hypothetical protein